MIHQHSISLFCLSPTMQLFYMLVLYVLHQCLLFFSFSFICGTFCTLKKVEFFSRFKLLKHAGIFRFIYRFSLFHLQIRPTERNAALHTRSIDESAVLIKNWSTCDFFFPKIIFQIYLSNEKKKHKNHVKSI